MTKRRWIHLLVCILCTGFGLGMGALSKYCDVAANPFLYLIGEVTSGISIWAMVCVCITLAAGRPVWAGAYVFFFLGGMLVAYYLVSAYYVGYTYLPAIRFWSVAAVASFGLGWLEWYIRTPGRLGSVLRCMTVLGVPLLIIADTVMIFDFWAIVASVALYAAFVWFLKRRLKLRLLPRVKNMDKKNHPQR